MGQHGRAGGRYIIPIDSNGATLEGTTAEGPGRGIFTLTAGATYFYILGGAASPYESVHITGYDSALVITGAVIQDCNHAEQDVLDKSVVAGEWPSEVPTTSYVSTDGTGWSQTNGAVAALGTGLGGALWHFSEEAAARSRLRVIVGAAGGRLRVSGHGKD